MSYKQRTAGQAGFSSPSDSNGYKVDHRSETERRTESKETKKLQDGQETHRQETRVINLEELKSRETSRIATAEDIRALLEAEFEGIREIQTSREISREEFNLIESQYRKNLGGKEDCQTDFKEEHRLENVLENPQWKTQFGMPVFTKNEIVDVREATVLDKNYPDPHISSSINVSPHKLAVDSGPVTTTTTDYPEGSLRHETKQKRHVIEEVFIEGSDKFYEETSPKKSRRDEIHYSRSTGELTEGAVQVRGITSSRDDDVPLREHNRQLMDVDTPTVKPRKKRTAQSELVVEDTDLFRDEKPRNSLFSQEYKIKPMYSEKSKPPSSQNIERYLGKEHIKAVGDKANTTHATSSSGSQQQEIVIGEVKTYREGTMDVDKNRSVEVINQDSLISGKSKSFKKRLNQKDIKLLPKTRRRQEEIVINDPTVYDETQFLSLRKAEKKKRLLETKTLPAKFGKKSKTQLDREVELILKKSEEIAGKKHVPISDVPEQVVLDEPDVFRETSTRKKLNISHGSLEKQQKQLEKMERELETKRLKHKGPQEEIVIDDPDVFREATLKKRKQEKIPESKIMKDIMQDIDVLTQEARKGNAEGKQLDELDSGRVVEHQKPGKQELVLEENIVHKENATKQDKGHKESKVIDCMTVEHIEIKRIALPGADTKQTEIVEGEQLIANVDLKGQGEVVKTDQTDSAHHHGQPEIVLDDKMLYADHNKPKNIHLDHGKTIQMAEIDDFDLPELEKSDSEKQTSDNKHEKVEKKSSKPKKFLFKKKKKSQGESVVDDSFVYEDAAKIRVPEVSKNEGKVASSGKTFWNWNFGQHKSQQEVIKDESHLHEDKSEADETKHAEPKSEHVTPQQEIIIQPPISFQDTNVDVRETAADVKVIHERSPGEIHLQESKPEEIKIDTSNVVISKPDVIKIDDDKKLLTLEDETHKKSSDSEEVIEEIETKGTPKEKHKFKINLPTFTIPKPHLNFGFKKHQQEIADDEKVTVIETTETSAKVELPKTIEENAAEVDAEASHKEIVREDETIAVEESQKSKTEISEKPDIEKGGQNEEVKQTKSDSHKSKFHFPSFTIPKPHLNFGFKKNQNETVEADKAVVVDETVPKLTEPKIELSKEKSIFREDVFVEESHDIKKDDVDHKLMGESVIDGDEVVVELNDDKHVHDKSGDHKFKINLPHIPKPHLNIHFKKSEDRKEIEEVDQKKGKEEEDGEAKDVKTDKLKITVPHINLNVPHIHFAHKQEEIVVVDESVIPDSSRVLIAEENIRSETARDDVQKKEEKVEEKPLVENSEHGEQVEIVKTDEVEEFKKDRVKAAGTLDEKSKKKYKFNFPHFSLPRSHGKQSESVACEAVLIEDSTKLKLSEKKVHSDENDEEIQESSVDKEDTDKNKKSDKFKIRLPKPHFKFGFKSKDKHKLEEVDMSKVTAEIEDNVHKIDLEVPVEADGEQETQKDAELEFLTHPCEEEFTDTVKYALESDENVQTGPVTITVNPEEYKTIVSKHKAEQIDNVYSHTLENIKPQITVRAPYYEYEPASDKEGEAVISEEPPVEQSNVDKSQVLKASEAISEPESTPQEKSKEEKHKSKFQLPCIKLKRPFLKKHGEIEQTSEDDPAYGEVSTEELKGELKQEHVKTEAGEESKFHDVTDTAKVEKKKKHSGFHIKSLGKKPPQGEVVVNDSHIYTDNSTLGRRLLNKLRPKDKVAPESDTFILENNLPESSENRQKFDHAEEQPVESIKHVTVEASTSKIEEYESDLVKQADVSKQDEVTEQDSLQGEKRTSPVDSSTLESSKGSEKGFDSLGRKYRKQDEVIVGGGSIITEPQSSPIHSLLHKHAKPHPDDKHSSQELADSEKIVKRKEHGKLTQLFYRSSDEYDLEHQKRTNQPLVELISSRQKLPEESDATNVSSTQEETSWSLSYRKNLTLDANNHLTFEPDQSVSVDNVQLLCPTARRSYRKQIQIDDFDQIKVIDETAKFTTSTPKKIEGTVGDGVVSEQLGYSTFITPGKTSPHEAKSQPVKWTSSLGKNTSYFSTLPEFATVGDQQKSPHFVVVAIDFGTTFSGYAFSFKNDVDSIHIMRKWEGGDPGVVNQKTPTTLLLTPEKDFHSFGFTARDFYHDLSPKEAKKWLYFEKFKMALHYNADLTSDTEIQAANRTSVKAQEVFAHSLKFFKSHALQEISEQTETELIEEDVKWIITVPAIWKEPAKQFMREAAYKAGIASSSKPEQLLIALEPEAASIFVRKQRLRQLIPEEIDELKDTRASKSNQDLRGGASSPVLLDTIAYQTQLDESSSWNQSVASNALSLSFQRCPSPTSFPVAIGYEIDITDHRFMVADCGGGTVDITVYEMLSATGGKLKELHKASGGPYGSIGVDLAFEKLLVSIFGQDFIDTFKIKRPAGWVDLMMAFESRKRAANPFKTKPLNVSLPFSFIDYYKKFKNATVESAIKKFNQKDVKWSSQGMLRLMPECMNQLFQPTLDNITEAMVNVLNQPDVSGVKHIFLVGGFAESPMLQQEVRKNFAHLARILIPSDVSLTILKGAVLYGIDPSIVVIRKSRLTYGLGVLNRFAEGKHPESKKAIKDGVPWCVDVFDHLVLADQSVALGSSVIRSYTPAGPNQKFSLFHIYCTERREVDYVTDEGVVKCGTLRLDLDDHQWELESNPSRPVSQNLQDADGGHIVDGSKGRREIQARLTFGDTEIKIIALDVATGNYVRATLDFLNK